MAELELLRLLDKVVFLSRCEKKKRAKADPLLFSSSSASFSVSVGTSSKSASLRKARIRGERRMSGACVTPIDFFRVVAAVGVHDALRFDEREGAGGRGGEGGSSGTSDTEGGSVKAETFVMDGGRAFEMRDEE
jgi:hypothetical protein